MYIYIYTYRMKRKPETPLPSEFSLHRPFVFKEPTTGN